MLPASFSRALGFILRTASARKVEPPEPGSVQARVMSCTLTCSCHLGRALAAAS